MAEVQLAKGPLSLFAHLAHSNGTLTLNSGLKYLGALVWLSGEVIAALLGCASVHKAPPLIRSLGTMLLLLISTRVSD